jgi:hypothetical protein
LMRSCLINGSGDENCNINVDSSLLITVIGDANELAFTACGDRDAV